MRLPGGAGAKYYMQMSMTTLDRIGEEPEPPDPSPNPEAIEAQRDALENMVERIYDRGERATVNFVRTLVAEQVDLVAGQLQHAEPERGAVRQDDFTGRIRPEGR